jgi:peptidyl-prolyl cis-trans isomerase SurA
MGSILIGSWIAGGTNASAQGNSRTPGPRQSAVVEGVAAVVGDRPILRSEVEEQFETFAPQFNIDPADTAKANQLRRDILENLIAEQLLIIEAEKEGIKVDEAQVQQAVDESVKGDRERLGAEGFAKELQNEGLTEVQLRSRYAEEARKEYLRSQLLKKDVFSKVAITDADVQKSFQDNREKIGKKPRALRVLDLFVRVAPDSMVEKNYRKNADEIRQKIAGGLSMDAAAREFSDDENSRENGGLLPRFGPGSLGDRTFEQLAFTLPIGEISDVIRTNLGYHVIQVVARDPNQQWTQIRHVLVKVTPSRTDENRARAKISSIRDQIVTGKIDFADAVRRYSDDVGTREQGGDIGWLPIDSFLGETKDVVDSLKVGQISKVAAVEGGFHIFKLMGEQAESDYVFDEIKDQLRDMVEKDARQKQLETYLADLRTRTFVEIRPMQ